MSSDRIVSEYIIRQAQQQIWGESTNKTSISHKRGWVNSTLTPSQSQDLVDLLSNESENIEECSLENGDMIIFDDVDHSVWFPVPCSRIIHTHKRHFGNLPGFWNKLFKKRMSQRK